MRYYPDIDQLYYQKKWRFPETIDRVYIIEKAEKILGFNPRYNYLEYFMSKKLKTLPDEDICH